MTTSDQVVIGAIDIKGSLHAISVSAAALRSLLTLNAQSKTKDPVRLVTTIEMGPAVRKK